MLDPDGFDQAMAGCGLVFHTASPLIVRAVDDPLRDLVEPATRGTQSVLDAANRTASVRRIVVISSIVAVYGDAADLEDVAEDRFDESHGNATSTQNHQPYSYSKPAKGDTAGRGQAQPRLPAQIRQFARENRSRSDLPASRGISRGALPAAPGRRTGGYQGAPVKV